MKHGAAAVAVAIALAVPALGQHAGAHGGFAGHGGSVGHSGIAGHAGFSGSRGFSGRVASPPRSGGGFRGPTGPMRPGFGFPHRELAQHRPAYRPGFGSRYGDHDRDHRHRGWYGGAYGYAYPGWGYVYPYPYVIDPGLYDWGAGDYDQNSAANNYPPYSDYNTPYSNAQPEPYYSQPPYPQDQGAPQRPYYAPPPYAQPYPGGPAASGGRWPAMPAPTAAANAAPEEPLTVVFKDGRAAKTMRNYIMNSQALTDMDPQHYAQIPLDEIDLTATAKLNRARGVDFEVPGPVRE